MKRKHINSAFESVILILAIVACALFFLALISMVVACSPYDDAHISYNPNGSAGAAELFLALIELYQLS